MNVLIADDDSMTVALLDRQLRKAGFTPVRAANGLEAWDYLQKHDVGLALLDWEMPGLSGPEICQRLAELKRIVYAIILTAQDDDQSVAVALDSGASDYIVKPWTTNVLIARVHVGARTVGLHAQLAHAQKLESIGQLAAGVAHEINTPIQYIGDNIRFLRDSVQDLLHVIDRYTALLDPSNGEEGWAQRSADIRTAMEELEIDFVKEETPRAIEQSLEGVERVAKIVRSMKEFSHPGVEDKLPADLNRAIENTITVSCSEWKLVATVTTDLDPTLPTVPCHLGALNQVILNIIVNAAHAIGDVVGQGGGQRGTISISTSQVDTWAEIRITDTGPGIAPEHKDRIFDPFFTTKDVGVGTGQGLALAHDTIVRKHGGQLIVESEVGKGATFVLRLPLLPDDNKWETDPMEAMQDEEHSVRR